MLPADAPLSDWLVWLETLSPTEINLGLDRVNVVLERLAFDRAEHRLLIAGTNGKGSSVTMTAALLRAAGLRVGAYTSPHIHSYNERIVIDGVPVADADIVAAFEQIERVRDGVELTYFEFGTLAAFMIFAKADLDVWVIEVGLGGRLDATNAIDPTASLITNVALDHCEWLGDNVETIGAEKAGVMRSGVPTVFGSDDIPASVMKTAADKGALLLAAGAQFHAEIGSNNQWTWHGSEHEWSGLEPPGLVGRFQIANAAAVLTLLEASGLLSGMNPELINAVLPKLTLAGRAQKVEIAGEHWLFDVAHNPAAAGVLAETLSESQGSGSLIAIAGVLADKDLEGLLGPLNSRVDRWIAIKADNPRAFAARELARRIANFTNKPCQIAESPAAAIQLARQGLEESDKILVTGSFFAVGPVFKQLTIDTQS